MKFLKTFETHENGMSREDMCDMLCKCGYTQEELDGCSNSELQMICKNAQEAENISNGTNESKGEKSIQDVIKRPGSLPKKARKEVDKITNLNKKLKGLKEHQEQENYMFFANVENICRFCQEILAMDKHEVDKILSDGHGWATDHIATSKDDVEEVVNFLKTHKIEKSEDSEIHSSDGISVQKFTSYR